MSEDDKLLCVGGPYDGRYIYANKQLEVYAIVPYDESKLTNIADLSSESILNELMSIRFKYVRSEFTFKNYSVEILCPEQWDLGELMKKLIEGYKETQ